LCEQHDRGGVKESLGRGDRGLEVLGQTAVSVDPGEEAFDHSAAWLDGEADLIGVLADDLDGDDSGVGDAFSGIAAIGEDLLDEGKGMVRGGSSGPPPSRSWMSAEWGVSTSPRPSVSTRA